MDKFKRIETKIEEARKRLETIENEINKVDIEMSEMKRQIQLCQLVSSDTDEKNILERQQKKHHVYLSFTNSKESEIMRIRELEDLMMYMKQDLKRADRLFNHL